MTETSLTTQFSKHYLSATQWMLEAMETPSAARWTQALAAARSAEKAGYDLGEWTIAGDLQATIIKAARVSGYFNLGS